MDKILAIIKRSPVLPTGAFTDESGKRRYQFNRRLDMDIPIIICHRDESDWYKSVWENMFTTRDLVLSYRPELSNEFHICIRCFGESPVSSARDIFPMVGFIFATPCTTCGNKAIADYAQFPAKMWLMIESGLLREVVNEIFALM